LRPGRRSISQIFGDKSSDNRGFGKNHTPEVCAVADTLASPPTDWPLYWFARLEKSVEQGDHQAAAEAQRELARLGVRVRYGRPRPRREAAHAE
jgi:hypothetical protein